jgi:hypothetical protein
MEHGYLTLAGAVCGIQGGRHHCGVEDIGLRLVASVQLAASIRKYRAVVRTTPIRKPVGVDS